MGMKCKIVKDFEDNGVSFLEGEIYDVSSTETTFFVIKIGDDNCRASHSSSSHYGLEAIRYIEPIYDLWT